MDPKPRPNHRRYLEVLRAMTPEQRLMKTFELSEMGKDLLRAALHRRFRDAPEEELYRLFLDCLEKCHNRNY